jgi:hypothetical protein
MPWPASLMSFLRPPSRREVAGFDLLAGAARVLASAAAVAISGGTVQSTEEHSPCTEDAMTPETPVIVYCFTAS